MSLVRIALQFKPSVFKRSFILLLILSFFLQLNEVKGQSLSLYAGPSLPFGSYGSNNITRKESGFAKTGYHAGFLLEDQRKVRVLNTFFQFSYNQNNADGEVIRSFLMINNPLIKGSDITAPWSQFIFMPGLKANWFRPGFDLYAKAGLGFGVFRSFTQIQYYDSLRFVLRDEVTANGLVVNVGLGANINLNPSVALCLGIDMQYANVNYGRINFLDGNGNILQVSENDEVVPFQAIQWHLGLRFNLGKK